MTVNTAIYDQSEAPPIDNGSATGELQLSFSNGFLAKFSSQFSTSDIPVALDTIKSNATGALGSAFVENPNLRLDSVKWIGRINGTAVSTVIDFSDGIKAGESNAQAGTSAIANNITQTFLVEKAIVYATTFEGAEVVLATGVTAATLPWGVAFGIGLAVSGVFIIGNKALKAGTGKDLGIGFILEPRRVLMLQKAPMMIGVIVLLNGF